MARSCTFCGRSGHTQARCFSAHPELRPTCSNCLKKGHTESRCWAARVEEAPTPDTNDWPAQTEEAPATDTNNWPAQTEESLQADRDELVKSMAKQTAEYAIIGDIKPATMDTFDLTDLPTEEVIQTIRKWDVRKVVQALEGSRIAPCTILQNHIESLPHFQEFEKNREQIFQNFKDIEGLQRAVDKAKDFARWSIQPDIRKWTYDNVVKNYTEAPCPRCLDSEVKDHLTATDGMLVCRWCFFDDPEYRLALNVEEMKYGRMDTEMYDRPSVGWAKDYLTTKRKLNRPMVCKHGKNIGNTQEIQLSREGGRTWASMGKKLWAKVIPYWDRRSDFVYTDQEGFYSAEGCNQHPLPSLYPEDRIPDIKAYDPDELRL
ncbi:hypothetical protein LQW54_004764 [Pestalotiopsis sp. IQ-011]